MTWELRRARIEDLPALIELEREAYPADPWSSATMSTEVRGMHSYYVVAHPVGEPAVIDGYAGLMAPRGAAEVDVQTLTVAASARRRGLGRTLLNALLNEASRRGAREVFLEVRVDNPNAQALYESAGFEAVGLRKHYYQPEGIDALTMKLTIPEPTTALAASGTTSAEDTE